MNIVEIINKKRLGKILSEEEIAYAVNGYLSGEVKDLKKMQKFFNKVNIDYKVPTLKELKEK